MDSIVAVLISAIVAAASVLSVEVASKYPEKQLEERPLANDFEELSLATAASQYLSAPIRTPKSLPNAATASDPPISHAEQLKWRRSPPSVQPPFEYLVRTELGISWTRARSRCRAFSRASDATNGVAAADLLELQSEQQAIWSRELLTGLLSNDSVRREGRCLALNAHRHLYTRDPSDSSPLV